MTFDDQIQSVTNPARLAARVDGSRQCPHCTAQCANDSAELSLAAAELGLLNQFFGISQRDAGKQS
jgi:hypothetical protein